MILRNGVIASSIKHYDGSYLITRAGVYKLPQTTRSLEGLLSAAHRYELDALWIVPGSVESWHAGNGVGDQFFESMTSPVTGMGVHPYLLDGEKITCMHAWRTKGDEEARRTIRVFFPEWDERWQLQGVTNPHELLATINLLENALGVVLDYSPGSTGIATMQRLNRGSRASWLAPIDFTGTPWLPTDEEVAEGASVPLSSSGTRKLAPTSGLYDMSEPLFFHAYDKSYGFGGAMSSVTVGEGAPLHVSGAPGIWNAKVPGIWRIPSGKWVYTPEMNYALQEKYIHVSQIVEAYCWPTYHQTMRSFAELFWEFDVATANEHPAARKAAKQIRSIGFGWLAMDTRQWRENPAEANSISAFYRPDIWGAVVAEMNVKMNYEANRLWNLGYEPIWRNCDELGFFSNDPNPRTAVPIVTRTGKGAFRHRYTIRVTDEILLAFLEECEDKASAFAECHALLLAEWRKQQKLYMDQTILVPAVSVHG